MPSKYNRKSRGGHKSGPVEAAAGSMWNVKVHEPRPVERALLKRITKKLARRQGKRMVERELAWEALEIAKEVEKGKAESFYDYYLQDQEDRLQDTHDDDWLYDPHYDSYDYDHSPFESSYSTREADRLNSKARGYSHLAAGTLVTEADVGKTVYQVLEEAYQRSYEDRYSLSTAW